MACETCIHFEVCSRLGGITGSSTCSDFKETAKNGYTIALPCEIGDTLYFISHYSGKLETDKVKYFTITRNGIKPILEKHNIKFWDYYEFGKNVFLTEADARKSEIRRVANV